MGEDTDLHLSNVTYRCNIAKTSNAMKNPNNFRTYLNLDNMKKTFNKV